MEGVELRAWMASAEFGVKTNEKNKNESNQRRRVPNQIRFPALFSRYYARKCAETPFERVQITRRSSEREAWHASSRVWRREKLYKNHSGQFERPELARGQRFRP
jgi:hypothetical protein